MDLVPTGRTLADNNVASVCKTLFGDTLDADVLLGVAKASPDPADVSTSGYQGRHRPPRKTSGPRRKPYGPRPSRSYTAGKKTGQFLGGAGSKVTAGAAVAYGVGRSHGRKKERDLNDLQYSHGYQSGGYVGKAAGKSKLRPSRKTLAVAGAGYAAGNARGRVKGKQDEQLEQYRRATQHYGKRDNTAVVEGTFSKFDDEKQLAFGWASIVELNGEPVVDKQGDYITIDDLEDAAYTYVHKSRVGGNMHRRNGSDPHHVSDMVESIVFTDDKIAKMGLPDDFPRGWWVGFKVHDPETWESVRKGERSGFSIHGKGTRKDTALDEVMGYSVTKARDFDPERERQHRQGQASGAAGVAGAGLVGAGARGIHQDTSRFNTELDAVRGQMSDYNDQMRQKKKRTLRGTSTLNDMARSGKLRGGKRALVLSGRNVGALAAGTGALAGAAALDRDARSSRGRAWN